MKIIEKWPKWLPYPSAWIRAIASITFWVPWFVAILANIITYEEGNPSSEDFGTAVFLALLMGYVVIHATVEHKIKKDKLKLGLLIWHGFYSAIVSITSSILPSFLAISLSREVYYYGQRRIEISREATIICLILYLIIAAFLFHWENLLGLWINKGKKKRRKKQEFEEEFLKLKQEAARKRREKIAKCKQKSWVSRNKNQRD